jgi:hypothetical protein
MKTDKLPRYLWIGRKDLRWYEDAQSLFEELFPGRVSLVAKLFAATSINTSLKANITLFRRALHEIDNNLPIGDYMPNIKAQLEQIRGGADLTGRKIRSFAAAMSGDQDAVVVDIWILRAFDMDKKYFRKDPAQPTLSQELEAKVAAGQLSTGWDGEAGTSVSFYKKRGLFRSSGATDKTYTLIENYIRDEARAMGLQPRQFCAMLWSGVRIDQSGDRETHYKTLLRQKFYNLFTPKV